MATENRGWDTSTSFIRRTLRECIQKGRNTGGKEGPELWEAYRLLGQGLHTLEDFTAHSNWVEIALRKLGHNEVFCHVGDNGWCFRGEDTDAEELTIWPFNQFMSIHPTAGSHRSLLERSVARTFSIPFSVKQQSRFLGVLVTLKPLKFGFSQQD